MNRSERAALAALFVLFTITVAVLIYTIPR